MVEAGEEKGFRKGKRETFKKGIDYFTQVLSIINTSVGIHSA